MLEKFKSINNTNILCEKINHRRYYLFLSIFFMFFNNNRCHGKSNNEFWIEWSLRCCIIASVSIQFLNISEYNLNTHYIHRNEILKMKLTKKNTSLCQLITKTMLYSLHNSIVCRSFPFMLINCVTFVLFFFDLIESIYSR